MKLLAWLFTAAAVLLAVPAQAQSALVGEAMAAGQVGERYDGYMGFVGTPSAELRRQVAAINIRRRNLYIDLASRRSLTPQQVGMATACQLLSQLGVGEAYMPSEGTWRRHSTGQAVAMPDYCR